MWYILTVLTLPIVCNRMRINHYQITAIGPFIWEDSSWCAYYSVEGSSSNQPFPDAVLSFFISSPPSPFSLASKQCMYFSASMQRVFTGSQIDDRVRDHLFLQVVEMFFGKLEPI